MYQPKLQTMENFIQKVNQNYHLQQCTNVKCETFSIIYFEYETSCNQYNQAFMCITFQPKYLSLLHINEDFIIEFNEQKVVLKLKSWQIDHNHMENSFSNSRIYLHFVHNIYFHFINKTSRIFFHSNLSFILHDILKFPITGEFSAEKPNITTQYDENDINFINRLLHESQLKWKCNDDGGIHIYKQMEIKMEDTQVRNLSFGCDTRTINSFNYYDTHASLQDVIKGNKSINDENQILIRQFSNESNYKETVKLNEETLANTPHMYGRFYCDKHINLNSIYHIHEKSIIEHIDNNWHVVATKFTTYFEQSTAPYEVYICDKIPYAKYTIPQIGLQTATVNNTYIGQCNYLSETMCCTAVFHFDTRQTRIPVYISSTIANHHAQYMTPLRQNTMISAHFFTPSYPVFVNSIFNIENRIHDNFLENHCKYGMLAHSVEPSSHEICNVNNPNDAGNNTSRFTSIIINTENEREILEIQPAKDMSIIMRKGIHKTSLEEGDIILNIHKGNYLNQLNDGRFSLIVSKNIEITSEDSINIKAPRINIDSEELNIKSTTRVSIETANITTKSDISSLTCAVNTVKCNELSLASVTATCQMGDCSITTGATEIETGDIDLTSGAIQIESGDIELASGAIEIEAAAIFIETALFNIEGIAMMTLCIIDVLISEAAIINGAGSGIYVAGIP